MRKVTKLSAGIIAIAIMLVISPQSWGQSKKAAAAPLAPRSVSAGSASEVKRAPSDRTTSANAVTPAAATKTNSGIAGVNKENPTEYALAKTRMMLNDKSLTPEQVSQVKAKIAALEKQQAIEKSKVENNSLVPATENVAKILAAKKFTRSEFLALNEQDQRQVLLNINHLNLTDLVNATPEVLKSRANNVYFISANDFRSLNVTKQITVLQNPANYIIVNDESLIPRATMTRAELNTYSPERKKAILDAKQVVITD